MKDKLTIITPTPSITTYMKTNFKTANDVSWLIVWTNPEKVAPSQLGKNIKITSYPKKYLPINDFSFLRNWSLKQVKTPWVLFLDSDEVLDQSSWQKLTNLLKKPKPLVSGYLIKREDVFLGKTLKHGEVGNVWILRLGKRKFMRYQGIVHEIARIEGMIKKSPVVIKHYSHSSISTFLEKIFFYAKLRAGQSKDNQVMLWLKLLFYPSGKFIYSFILKLGFLDGMRGLTYASCMSLHSLLVRVFQLEKT